MRLWREETAAVVKELARTVAEGKTNGHTSPVASTPNTPSKLNGSMSNGNENENNENSSREKRVADMVCSLENKDECLSCGS